MIIEAQFLAEVGNGQGFGDSEQEQEKLVYSMQSNAVPGTTGGTTTHVVITAEDGEDAGIAELRAELSTLKLKALKKWARDDGVSTELLEDADDADDIRAAVIQLILEPTIKGGSGSVHQARAALETELADVKLKALKKRARASGVSQDSLDDADDADDIRGAVVALIITAELEPDASSDRPHFGVSAPTNMHSLEPKPDTGASFSLALCEMRTVVCKVQSS
jgi:hypothetical protein